MIVADASAVVGYLLRQPGHRLIADHLRANAADLHAPHLLDVEVTHTLRRYESQRAIDAGTASSLMAILAAFPIRRHAHTPLLRRAWALRSNLTAYDAMYVALAEALDATLLTQDRRLGTAAGRFARVEVIP